MENSNPKIARQGFGIVGDKIFGNPSKDEIERIKQELVSRPKDLRGIQIIFGPAPNLVVVDNTSD